MSLHDTAVRSLSLQQFSVEPLQFGVVGLAADGRSVPGVCAHSNAYQRLAVEAWCGALAHYVAHSRCVSSATRSLSTPVHLFLFSTVRGSDGRNI